MKTSNKKILIANGVNLDLLGRREPELYGTTTLETIEKNLQQALPRICEQLQTKESFELVFFQTNDETAYLHKLDEDWWGAILNPGAWTHTSLALADRLAALKLRFVEVHLTSISSRESYRHNSYCSQHAIGVVQGFGAKSYEYGLYTLLENYLSQSM